MKQYLWETHMHTKETSRCGRCAAARMVRAYKDAGYHGIVVTDHFLNGNSVPSKTAPWQARIDRMLKGYLAAKRAGEKLGITVLFGWEYYWQGADFLTFGLHEDFLRDQPDLCDISIETYIRRVRGCGGLVSQAHPFREAIYLPPHVEKRWDIVDAIEVINGSHAAKNRSWDEQAQALAKSHGLIQTAGSDAHSLDAVATAAVAFDTPFITDTDFVAALRANLGKAIRLRQ